MVTRAQLQRQTRAVQLARRIRSRKIEALQTQALTQRSLLEQTQLLEQQKEAAKKVSIQPTTTQRAFEQIIRAAEGKRTAVTSDIANEYVRLLEQNPELQEAVNRGQVAGIRARELGFTSASEFLGVSQALTQSKIETITPIATATEKELRQSLPKDLRKLPVTELVTRQNLLAGQTKLETEAKRFIGGFGTPTEEKINKLITQLGQSKQAQILKKQLGELVETGIREVKEITPGVVKEKLSTTFDVVSGGLLTQRVINKDSEKLFKDIEKFNEKFVDGGLTEKKFKVASLEQDKLNERVKDLDLRQDTLDSSTKKRIGNLVWGLGALGVSGEDIKVDAGIVPITPAIGLPRNIKIKFVGTQKVKGNKIITDIIYELKGKKIGIAKGVTILDGKRGLTITLGKQGVKVPKGKTFVQLTEKETKQLFQKIKRGRGFVGIDKSVVRRQSIKLFGEGKVKLTKFDKKKLIKQAKRKKKKLALEEELEELRKQFSALSLKKIKKKRLKESARIRRRNIIRNKISQIQSKLRNLKNIKIITQFKEIKSFTKGSRLIRKQNLEEDILVLRKQFSSLSAKKVKGKLLRKSERVRRRNIILNKIDNLKSKIKNVKKVRPLKDVIKTFEKLKETKSFLKGSRLARSQKLERDINILKKQFDSFGFKQARKKLLRNSERIRIRNIIKNKIETMQSRLFGLKKKKLDVIEKLGDVKTVKQFSAGRIKIGKRSRDINDIVSQANVFNREDLSLIIGKAITGKGDRILFRGLIRGRKDVSTTGLSLRQQVVFKKALKNVLSVASAGTKGKKFSRLSKVGKTIVIQQQAAQVIKPITKAKQIQRQKQRQAFIQSVNQFSEQQTKIKQETKQIVKLLQVPQTKTQIKLVTRQLQKQNIKQKLRLRQIQRQVTQLKPLVPIPNTSKLKVIPIVIPKPVIKTKLTRAIKKLGKKKAVNIIVGMKTNRQRIIGRGLPPYKALRKARKFVDSNIEASFRLIPTGKRPKQKDIKPFNIGIKFRGSKRNPLFQVEKRRFRLDTFGEKRQIKQFKIKAPSGFFPKVKKKRRKKK